MNRDFSSKQFKGDFQTPDVLWPFLGTTFRHRQVEGQLAGLRGPATADPAGHRPKPGGGA